MEPVTRPTASPAPAMSRAEERRLRESAREIEAVFVQQLLKTMRQASPGGPLSGTGQRVYQDMMDQELGRAIAKGGGLGLADMLVRDILRRQGAEKNPSSEAPQVPTKVEGGKP
jgi:flagellar protein FlgJ